MNEYDNSTPIDPRWTTTDDRFLKAADALEAALQIGGQQRKTRQQTLAFLVACVRQQKYSPNGWISYGRGPAFYSELENNAIGLTYKFKDVIDKAEACKLLTHIAGFKDWNGGSRHSRFRPTKILIEDFIEKFGLNNATYSFEILPTIVRTKKRRDVTAKLSKRRIAKLSDPIKRYNSFLVKQKLTLPGGGNRSSPQPYLDRIQLQRIFNRGNLKYGGRLYGGWWQSLSKEQRSDILINDEKTIELDLTAQHLHLLYAKEGIPAPLGDPYKVDGLERTTVKTMFLTALNAKSKKAAWQACLKELRSNDDELEELTSPISTFALYQEALEKFFVIHPRLRTYLCTDWGILLQRIDSEIAISVICDLADKDIPALPIHDSFIVAASKEKELRNAVSAAYAKLEAPWNKGIAPLASR